MNDANTNSAERTLEGWKEIAAFLNRDARTVRRWEKSEGLPVHRHLHQARSSVYALPAELNAWKDARIPCAEQVVAWWRPRPALGLAAAIFLLMFSFRGGPLAELQAQAQTKPAPTVTEVFSDLVHGNLALDWDGSLSPDGKSFAETDWASGNLAVWNLSSKQVMYLTHTDPNGYAIEPRWSADGLRVAYGYCYYHPPTCELRIGGLAGGEPEVAYRSREQSLGGVLDWSADGKVILTKVGLPDRKLALGAYDVGSHQMSVLRTFDTAKNIDAKVSSDSQTVAYSAVEDRRHIGIISLATRTDVELDSAADDRAPIWSKDGKALLFVSNRSGRWDLWAQPIGEGKPKGEPRMVHADIGFIVRFAGWLDDHTLLYSKDSTPSGNIQTAAIDPANGTLLGEPKPAIPHFIGQHLLARWSPDRQTIAFLAGAEDPKLYTYNAPTRKLRQIDTGKLARFGVVGWYPSGDALALWSTQNPKGVATLYRASLSGDLQELFHDEQSRGTNASVSSDLNTFAYVRHIDATDHAKPYSSICIYDLKGHKLIKEIVPAPGSIVFQPQLSSDARWLFYVERSGSNVERLVAAPVGPGTPRTVITLEGGWLGRLAASPDGSYLAYTWIPKEARDPEPGKPSCAGGAGCGIKLFIISTRGGKPQALDLPKYKGTTNFTWSPDGKQIGYITAESKAQWLALSNFLPQ